MVNPMCLDCKKYQKECNGTEVMAYNGCVYKEKESAK